MHIETLTKQDQRHDSIKDRDLIRNKIEYIPPVSSSCNAMSLFDKFRQEDKHTFFPVVNRYEEPLGIIKETAFKKFLFHKFGRQLLENPAFGKDLNGFLTRIPVADIHSSVEKMLEVYAQFNSNEGILIVDNHKYVGFIRPQSLLKIINEKNLSFARNQNPLTKLPGNTMIHEYFSRALVDTSSSYLLVYFDFDNFKPFNDTYGFRNGDRLILMFSELLKDAEIYENRFAGHIGGDDFFLGIKGGNIKHVCIEMKQMTEKFRLGAESFYDTEAIKNGYILANNRDGKKQKIPLVSISTAILELPSQVDRFCSIEEAANIIAKLKKKAKNSSSGFCVENIMKYITNNHCSLLDSITNDLAKPSWSNPKGRSHDHKNNLGYFHGKNEILSIG
ncbi:diguanylate cyclase domain-containing protein [Desulfamplus magnetovallimortis]|nr:diguanylate cyclase [Desulfamplus magnetovallimortis]